MEFEILERPKVLPRRLLATASSLGQNDQVFYPVPKPRTPLNVLNPVPKPRHSVLSPRPAVKRKQDDQDYPNAGYNQALYGDQAHLQSWIHKNALPASNLKQNVALDLEMECPEHTIIYHPTNFSNISCSRSKLKRRKVDEDPFKSVYRCSIL